MHTSICNLQTRRGVRRCLRSVRAIGTTALLLSLPTIGSAQQVAIAGYPIPTANAWPLGIVAGPDGALWFTELGTAPIHMGKIGRVTTAGVITEYPLATSDSSAAGITAGPDGALWFTVWNSIGRITTEGVITEYPVPTANASPYGITAGPDGALWFTESEGNNIGRITTAGVITEYPVPTANSMPWGITAGPDGALWFTEASGSNIGRVTTAGVITEYPAPTPYGITAGPDGALWFTEYEGNIGRITTAGAITQYPLPYSGSSPFAIAAGPDGALWFTMEPASDIGRITTAGVVTLYPLPTPTREVGGPGTIAAGPDGALWFTETIVNNIGQAVFVTAGLSVDPASGVYKTGLTFTGTAFAPHENVQIYEYGIGTEVLASATADGSGSFTATARNPQCPYGPRLFFGVGQTSGTLGAADFSVTPRLILSPNTGPTGSTVAAHGFGFGSLEPVEIYWISPRILLGTVMADRLGTFSGSAALTFTVPGGAAPGVNKVHALGETTGARSEASFTVQ